MVLKAQAGLAEEKMLLALNCCNLFLGLCAEREKERLAERTGASRIRDGAR